MESYMKKAEMLKSWTAAEVKAQPVLVVGQLCSAAATIERLGAEVDRLNRENFWLTKTQETKTARTITAPPLKRGDLAYAIGSRGGGLCIKQGPVSLVEIEDGRVMVHVKYAGCGRYGEQVFATREDAEMTLLRMKLEGKA